MHKGRLMQEGTYKSDGMLSWIGIGKSVMIEILAFLVWGSASHTSRGRRRRKAGGQRHDEVLRIERKKGGDGDLKASVTSWS